MGSMDNRYNTHYRVEIQDPDGIGAWYSPQSLRYFATIGDAVNAIEKGTRNPKRIVRVTEDVIEIFNPR